MEQQTHTQLGRVSLTCAGSDAPAHQAQHQQSGQEVFLSERADALEFGVLEARMNE